jgi:hypothetical protein
MDISTVDTATLSRNVLYDAAPHRRTETTATETARSSQMFLRSYDLVA